MWYNLGKWVLRNRLPLIIVIILSTAFMTFFALKVQRSYDFAKAIPVDHPKFLEYEAFKQKFGEDGSLLVIGFEKKDLFQLPFFQTFVELQQQIKQVAGVEDVLSVSAAVNLVKDSATEKLRTSTVFPENIQTQTELDSCKDVLLNLPFYKGLFYNYDAGVYMLAVRLNREVLNSKKRQSSVDAIVKLVRQQIGAVASLRNVVIVNRLPKTRSGKILRKLMRSITDGEDFQIPSTIDDEAIVGEIIEVLKKYKIGIYSK